MMQQQAAPQPAQQASADAWKCSCGNMATGKFCSNCGSTKPVADTWQCSCGHMATGKFCSNCGSKKVEAVTACPSCGNPFPDPANPPRFCNNCGHKMF
jgi:membrane protease subunit (stomatin/prohibitin family)